MTTLTASLSITGREHHIVSCRLSEGLSQVTSGTLEISSSDDIDVGSIVGATAQLALVVDGAAVRTLSLLVGSAAFRRIESGSLRFALALCSPFWKLTHTRDVRKFRNLSAKDIISRVLDEGGIGHTWSLVREPQVRKYCTQYRESHFDFVNRLLEFEGIHFHARDDGTMLLSDDTSSAPPVAGVASFSLLEHAGNLEGDVGIHELGKGARVSTGRVTVNDYNWKTPATDLLTSNTAELDGDLEIYDYPAGFRKPADGAAIAAPRLEAARCRTRFVTGRSNVPSFMPGHTFTYEGLAAGEYLLVSVTHEVHDEAFVAQAGGEQTTYENRFEAIPSAVRFRPALATRRPVVSGAHTAMVRGPAGEEIHTDKYGRMRAQFHWDREATGTDDDSRWLRKVQETGTGANFARVGWEVSVSYIDGDPDRPIGLARNINGVMLPTYTQPANMHTMTIKTPTYPSNGGYNEVKLVDRAGAMLMHVRAQKYLMNAVVNDKTEDIRHDETHVIDRRLARAVRNDQTFEVGRDRTTIVGGSRQSTVSRNRSDTIMGDEKIRSEASITVSVTKRDTENVGSSRITLAGSISPPDISARAKTLGGAPKLDGLEGGLTGGLSPSLSPPSPSSLMPSMPSLSGGFSGGGLESLLRGNIGRVADTTFSRTVGGAKITISADQIVNEAGAALVDLVGGAKITAAGGAVKNSVGGPNVHLVGAADFRTCDDDMGISAETSTILVGGVASVWSGKKLELHSDVVTVRMIDSLRLAAGDDLAIEMTPSKITFTGPMLLTAGEKVTVAAATEDDLTADGEAAQ